MVILQQKGQLSERNHQLQREIQERQQSQATLEQMQIALQASEARFDHLWEHLSIPLALISLDERWLRVNPALCELLGYTEAELLNQPISAYLHRATSDHSELLLAQPLELAAIGREPIELIGYQPSGQHIQTWAKIWPSQHTDGIKCYMTQLEVPGYIGQLPEEIVFGGNKNYLMNS